MHGRSIGKWLALAGALLVLTAGCRPARPPEGSVTLNWTAPTENEDDTALEDLAGYKVYWGQSSGGPYANSVSIEDESETSYVVEGLADGQWYFVVTAVNDDQVESQLSNEVRVVIADGRRAGEPSRVAERPEEAHAP